MSKNSDEKIKRIVIVGGGTAGWIAAAGLSSLYKSDDLSIRLVESEAIGTVGVGEATVPHIRHFNVKLGIDERDFMQKTSATFKLGIEFCDWNRKGQSYVHPFGAYGEPVGGVGFHHHWVRMRKRGDTRSIDDFSLPVKMSHMARFMMPSSDMRAVESTFSYAYQFDAGLYAAYLRAYAEARGVVRTEGRITGVNQNAETGFVEAVVLESGEVVEGDLFIDASGFRGLLIEQTLKSGYEAWGHWLPCDRAWAVPCEATAANTPYTRATARDAGWQWRIPLQHRVGNGYVFSSGLLSEDAARTTLMANLEGPAQAEPKMLSFTTGVRKQQWNKNVVAIGLASGFLEPLESTSIHLIQLAVTNLVEMLPDMRFCDDDRDEFNRVMHLEYERVRDFLILHYHATERDDTPFWDYCRTMTIPDSLAYKMALFRERGVIVNYKDGFFLEPSWLAVYIGQGVIPRDYDPLSERISDQALARYMADYAGKVSSAVQAMPSHAAFLEQYCPSAIVSRRATVGAV